MGIESHLTLQKYGYEPIALSESSTKPILIKCDFCLEVFDRKNYQLRKPSRREWPFACKKCDQVKSNWKRNNPNNWDPERYREFHESKRPKITGIDVGATIERFGYDPKNLSPRSQKPLVAFCAFCSSQYQTSLATLARIVGAVCCKSCSAVKSQFGTEALSADGLTPQDFFSRIRKQTDPKNLNIEATINKFGYSPIEIPPRSEREVIIKCFHCGCDFIRPMSSYTIFGPNISCGKPQCLTKKVSNSLMSKYGVAHSFDIPGVQSKLKNPKTESIVEDLLLNQYRVKYERNYVIGPYSFDFFLPDHDLLIECQGDFFHDFKSNGYSGTSRDQAKATYISNFTKHRLIWIWEHEIYIGRLRKILGYHLGEAQCKPLTFELSRLKLKPITNEVAHSFLSMYHYLGTVSSGSTSIGFYYDSELIAVICIGSLTRHETVKRTAGQINQAIKPSQIREIRRFCIRPNVGVKNLGSFCMSQGVKYYKQKNRDIRYIISFSHIDVGDNGGLYKSCNFRSLGKTAPSYHYMDGTRAIHKKTVYNLAIAAKMTESEFVKKANLIKISEKPKEKWIIVL